MLLQLIMEFISCERQDIFIFSLVLCSHENIKNPVKPLNILYIYMQIFLCFHGILFFQTPKCVPLLNYDCQCIFKTVMIFSIALINVIEGDVLYEVEQYCPREWFLLARCQPPGPLSSPVSVSKVCSSATGLKQLYQISKCLTTFKLYCLSIV